MGMERNYLVTRREKVQQDKKWIAVLQVKKKTIQKNNNPDKEFGFVFGYFVVFFFSFGKGYRFRRFLKGKYHANLSLQN